MPVYDTNKLADARTVARESSGSPQEALLYIAGYAEGVRDKPKRRKKVQQKANEERSPPLTGRE